MSEKSEFYKAGNVIFLNQDKSLKMTADPAEYIVDKEKTMNEIILIPNNFKDIEPDGEPES